MNLKSTYLYITILSVILVFGILSQYAPINKEGSDRPIPVEIVQKKKDRKKQL